MRARGRIKKAQFSETWVEVDKAAEEGLKVNPWDAQLNGAIGVIVGNNTTGIINMGGADATITIPSVLTAATRLRPRAMPFRA